MKKTYIAPETAVYQCRVHSMLMTSVTDLDALDLVNDPVDEFNLIPTDTDILPPDAGDDNIFV